LNRRLHARCVLPWSSFSRLFIYARLFGAARRFALRRLVLSVLLSSRRLAARRVSFLCNCWRRRQDREQRRG